MKCVNRIYFYSSQIRLQFLLQLISHCFLGSQNILLLWGLFLANHFLGPVLLTSFLWYLHTYHYRHCFYTVSFKCLSRESSNHYVLYYTPLLVCTTISNTLSLHSSLTVKEHFHTHIIAKLLFWVLFYHFSVSRQRWKSKLFRTEL
jgi:hypothetical protein